MQGPRDVRQLVQPLDNDVAVYGEIVHHDDYVPP